MTDAPMRYTLRLTPAGQGFVGRHDLIGQLDQAWADQSTRLVALVGLGGSGKSWLIDRWRSKLDRQGDLDRVGVFGWRFESPGRIAQHTDAAEQFFDQLAEELGVSSGGPTAPVDKADWLARALRGRRTLLILDGLEAVQGRDGALHDKALQQMLIELSRSMSGLCVLASRLAPAGIGPHPVLPVGPLESRAAVALLEQSGVSHSPEQHVEAVAERWRGHPLALKLLGRFAETYGQGRVSGLMLIDPFADDDRGDEGDAAPVERVIEAYCQRLAPADLATLRSIALFGEGCTWDMLDTLLAPPPIAGLTDAISAGGLRPRQRAVSRLRALGLLDPLAPEDRARLDMHPLIRAWFSRRPVDAETCGGWRAGHARLFDTFERQAREQGLAKAPTEVIRRAVRHGCAIGHHAAASRLYHDWLHDDEHDAVSNEQQALWSSLDILQCFFDGDWRRPSDQLAPTHRAKVMAAAGFRLQALGHTHAAVEPMRASVELRVEQRAWPCAANSAGNLSSLLLLTGGLSRAQAGAGRCAVEWAKRAVEYADRGEQTRQRASKRAILAEALHHAGRLDEAWEVFCQAEDIQSSDRPEAPRLSSIMSSRLTDLLLTRGRLREAAERATASAERSREKGWTLAFALDHLLLARCALRRDRGSGSLGDAALHLKRALDALRQCGRVDHQPKGWLVHAELCRRTGEVDKAKRALERVKQAIVESDMWLYAPPYHLEAAELALATDQHDDARDHADACRRVIDRTRLRRYEAACQALARRLTDGGR